MASIRREGPYYKIYFYYGNKLHKKSLKTSSKKVAEQIKRKIEDELAAGKFRLENYFQLDITLADFLAEAAQYSQNNKSRTTYEREKIIYRNFLNFCGNILLANVSLKLIEAYKEHLLKHKGFKPSGVNIELRHLSAAFSLAVKYEYLPKNPFKQMTKLKVPKKKPIFLTPEQAATLLNHTRGRSIYQHIFIALHTGARVSEICNLKWEDVDLKNRTVKFFGKGSKERTVPIPEGLREFLSRLERGSEFVVTGSRNTKEIARQFREYADQVGLERFTFHNLRDTYASWLVQRSVNLKVIQELLGHESIQTTLIYAHLAPDSRFAAVKAIDEQLLNLNRSDENLFEEKDPE